MRTHPQSYVFTTHALDRCRERRIHERWARLALAVGKRIPTTPGEAKYVLEPLLLYRLKQRGYDFFDALGVTAIVNERDLIVKTVYRAPLETFGVAPPRAGQRRS